MRKHGVTTQKFGKAAGLVWICLVWLSGATWAQSTTYHLHAAASSTPGLFQLQTLGPSTASASLMSGPMVAPGDYPVAAFDTQSGGPNPVGYFPIGSQVTFSLYMQATSNSGTAYPEARVYVNNPSGALLCRATASAPLTSNLQLFNFTCASAVNVGMQSTDRLYLWVGAAQSMNGASTFRAQLAIEGTLNGNYDSQITVANNSSIPQITSLSPASGPVGTVVTITGANFGTSQGSSTVTFNGTPATTTTSWSNTSITVQVPLGATSGNVVVSVAGVPSNGVNFTDTSPSISSLSVATGTPGTQVTISGANFGTSQGNSTVTFNGTPATTITNWSNGSVTVSVPRGPAAGNVNVVVTVNGTASNAMNFILSPIIDALSVPSGPVYTAVTVTGAGFGTTPGTRSMVAFGVTWPGATAPVTSWNSTSITVTVPNGLQPGSVLVWVTANGASAPTTSFTVTSGSAIQQPLTVHATTRNPSTDFASDSSGHGYNGTYQGEVTRRLVGATTATGYSVRFSGWGDRVPDKSTPPVLQGNGDRVYVPGNVLPTVPSQHDLSLAFWMNIDQAMSNSAAADWMMVMAKNRAANDPWTLAIMPGTGGTRTLRWVVGSQPGQTQLDVSGVPAGQFVHVVVTHHQGSPGVARIYVNGRLAGENTNATGFTDGTDAPLEIGSRLDDYFFHGQLDDVQIYNTALDGGGVAVGSIATGDVATLYNGGNGGTTVANLVARYALDETDNATIQVASLNPSETAIVVIDEWSHHFDVVLESLVQSLVPRINEGLDAARKLGIQVIFVPTTVTAPPDSSPLRQPIVSLPPSTLPTWPGNGFFVPILYAPFQDNARTDFSGLQGNMLPPGIWPSGEGVNITPVTQNGDLVINGCSVCGGGQISDVWIDALNWSTSESSDWGQGGTPVVRDLQELYNLTQAHTSAHPNGIKNLLFAGGGANVCEMYKGDGVVQAKRLGLKAYVLRDMSYVWAPNGVYWAQHHQQYSQQDPWLTPDNGKRVVYKWIEDHIDGTISANDLLAAVGPPYSYSTRIAGESGLVSYWRMNGNTGYRHVDDMNGTQGAWNAASVKLGQTGRAGNASAAVFDGTGVLIAAPFFRTDLPPASPLRSLSSAPFSVEAWINVSQYLVNTEFIAGHEGTDSQGTSLIDFLFGLDPSGRLTFSTRGETSPVVSSVSVPLGTWVHVVGVQDASNIRVYLNGTQVGSASISGSPSDVPYALLLGSRAPWKGAGFTGQMEDVAIYNTALSDATIAAHYAIGTH